MPFGVKNAPAHFQRIMDHVLQGLPFARCYIDDVIIFSDSFEQHLQHVEQVLLRIREAGLKCHPSKCSFAAPAVEYLGHQITPDGVSPQEAKVTAITNIAAPGELSGLRSFLGAVGYYRKFIPSFSSIAQPLNKLLQKGVDYVWGKDQQGAFERLKVALVSAPILRRPDYSRPFVLHTDWSRVWPRGSLGSSG